MNVKEGLLYRKILEPILLLHKGTDASVFLNLAMNSEGVLDEARKDFEQVVDRNYRELKCSEEYYSFWNEVANIVAKWFGSGK